MGLPEIRRTAAVEAVLKRRAQKPAPGAREGDLLVASGIEAGDRAALEWLLQETSRAAKTRRDLTPQLMKEVAAQAAEVIATGEEPRIRSWSGSGPLAGWIQVVTLRLATAVKEREPRGNEDEALAEQLEAQADAPELQAVKKKYRPVLSRALVEALEQLDARQKSLLRMHHLEGVSLDGLAKVHQVHRATVARWLADARERVLNGVREALMQGEGVREGEVDSLVRAAHTGLELSLRRLLQ